MADQHAEFFLGINLTKLNADCKSVKDKMAATLSEVGKSESASNIASKILPSGVFTELESRIAGIKKLWKSSGIGGVGGLAAGVALTGAALVGTAIFDRFNAAKSAASAAKTAGTDPEKFLRIWRNFNGTGAEMSDLGDGLAKMQQKLLASEAITNRFGITLYTSMGNLKDVSQIYNEVVAKMGTMAEAEKQFWGKKLFGGDYAILQKGMAKGPGAGDLNSEERMMLQTASALKSTWGKAVELWSFAASKITEAALESVIRQDDEEVIKKGMEMYKPSKTQLETWGFNTQYITREVEDRTRIDRRTGRYKTRTITEEDPNGHGLTTPEKAQFFRNKMEADAKNAASDLERKIREAELKKKKENRDVDAHIAGKGIVTDVGQYGKDYQSLILSIREAKKRLEADIPMLTARAENKAQSEEAQDEANARLEAAKNSLAEMAQKEKAAEFAYISQVESLTDSIKTKQTQLERSIQEDEWAKADKQLSRSREDYKERLAQEDALAERSFAAKQAQLDEIWDEVNRFTRGKNMSQESKDKLADMQAAQRKNLQKAKEAHDQMKKGRDEMDAKIEKQANRNREDARETANENWKKEVRDREQTALGLMKDQLDKLKTIDSNLPQLGKTS